MVFRLVPEPLSMSPRQYLRRFARKFVFDVLPGALASLIGALFFAQHWSQPAPALRSDAADQLARQSQEISRMVQEEHTLMVDFLKREQEREAARQPLTVGEMKARDDTRAKETAFAAARRPAAGPEPVRETKSASLSMPAPAAAPRALAAAPAAALAPESKPAGDIVAVVSGPLVAPEPKPADGFAGVTGWAMSVADKAIDLTGLRQVPALVRTIKGGTETIGSEFQTLSDARFVGVSR